MVDPVPKVPRRATLVSRRTKGMRARDALFSEVEAFDPRRNGFSAFGWLLRSVLFVVSPRGWQIFSLLALRAGPEAVVWLSDREIGFAVDINYRKVGGYLKELADLGLIAIASAAGERFIALRDPMEAVRRVLARPDLDAERRAALLADIEAIGIQLPVVVEESTPGATDSSSALAEGL